MPLYAITPEGLTPVPATSFETEGIRERQDIQRLVRDNAECLEEGLLVIAEEFGGWADSQRRIDLLCLDKSGNLVVVELKRTEDGGHMELQALRYAAMVSAMTFEQAADTLARHRPSVAPDHEAARTVILGHLGWTEPDEEAFAQETRVILVAADFGKEITTTVIWLRERYGVDIRCTRLRPHRMDDGRLLLDIQPLIPLPEATEFQTQIGAKQATERKERAERHELRHRFWSALLGAAKARTQLHASRPPTDGNWVAAGYGRAGFYLSYVTRRHDSQVELWMAEDKPAFRALFAQKESIEAAFGAPLEWLENAGGKGSRIRFVVPGGYRSPEEEWPALHETLIAAMIRLDQAFRQPVAALS